MIRIAALAGLLAFSAAIPALAAGDPAALAAVEPLLRDDEKAMLSAVLSDKASATEFDADVKLAGSDSKVMKLVLDKWRGRIVTYAEADSKIATPDVEGTYKNSAAMMTPATRAYLVRRLKTMKENDRNTLIDYLNSVDEALAGNNSHLTWYTKKVVAGIFDKYRQDLGVYLPTPIAKDAKAAAPGAGQALADLRRAAAPPALPPSVVVKDPAAAAPGKKPVTKPGGAPATVAVSSSTAALDQARGAAEAAERSGLQFDGGGTAPETGGVLAGGNGSGHHSLSPSTGGGAKPNIVGEVPSPTDADEDFLSGIKKMRTGPAPMKLFQYAPAGIGALIGGIIGFLLGGPAGALIGAGLGVFAGDYIGSRFIK